MILPSILVMRQQHILSCLSVCVCVCRMVYSIRFIRYTEYEYEYETF
jgi:hypothetical protein